MGSTNDWFVGPKEVVGFAMGLLCQICHASDVEDSLDHPTALNIKQLSLCFLGVVFDPLVFGRAFRFSFC